MNPVQIAPHQLGYVNHFLEEVSNHSDPLVITIDQTEGTITILQGNFQASGSDLLEVIEQVLGY